ncbi:hypothetical protein D3C80_2237040 [compost metagenome]
MATLTIHRTTTIASMTSELMIMIHSTSIFAIIVVVVVVVVVEWFVIGSGRTTCRGCC